MSLRGNDSIMAHNTLNSGYGLSAITVAGNNNTVADNILECGSGGGQNPAIDINGTGNVIRNNLGLLGLDRWSAGIRFFQSGNFYGGNHMAAQSCRSS